MYDECMIIIEEAIEDLLASNVEPLIGVQHT